MGTSCSSPTTERTKSSSADGWLSTTEPENVPVLFSSQIARMKHVAYRAQVTKELRGRELERLRLYVAFSPAYCLLELADNPQCERQALAAEDEEDREHELAHLAVLGPHCSTFQTALLFVDISGFTNLSTRLEVDSLQRHINNYFTKLIDVIVEHGGDVLRKCHRRKKHAFCLHDPD